MTLDSRDETRLRAVENAVVAMNDMVAELVVIQKRLPELLGEAIDAGITKAVNRDETMGTVWKSAQQHLTRRAREGAGGWLLGFLYRGAGWLMVFVVIASVAGWVPAWKIMSAAKP